MASPTNRLPTHLLAVIVCLLIPPDVRRHKVALRQWEAASKCGEEAPGCACLVWQLGCIIPRTAWKMPVSTGNCDGCGSARCCACFITSRYGRSKVAIRRGSAAGPTERQISSRGHTLMPTPRLELEALRSRASSALPSVQPGKEQAPHPPLARQSAAPGHAPPALRPAA